MTLKEKRISRFYFITSFAIIFLITIGAGTYVILGKYRQFKDFAYIDKVNDIENKKLLLKDIVESYLNQSNQIIASSEKVLDRMIMSRVGTAYQISNSIYDNMKIKHGEEETKEAIIAALAGMVYGNEYIFAFDMDGVIISSPLLKDIEGKNLINKQDSEGQYIFKESIKIIKEKGEGYLDTYWQNPSDLDAGLKQKRVYLKRFEPYDWVIGYGVYIEDHEELLKNEVIKQLESISYANNGYIFAATYDGVSLTKPAKGQNMYDVQDAVGVYIVRELINKAKHGGGFLEYVMPPFKGARPETKLSYVAPIPRWGWYIGTGLYITDIEAAYEARMEDLFASEKREIILIISELIVLLLLGGGLVYIFSKRLQILIDKYSSEINEKNNELSEMNKNLEKMVDEKTSELNALNLSLEHRVEEEVEKNREKDRIMFQQGRHAAMGEMIGNIAHQWRQPLSSISLLIQDMQEAYEVGEMNDDYMKDSVGKCTATIAHMSDTIDNFRYFFNPQKEKTDFDVDIEIKRCLSLLDAGLENNHIAVSTDFKCNKNVYGVPGEYSQVLVNILNNAKDILLDRKVPSPYISVKSYVKGNRAIVEVCDNGGGINADIIDRVFEPYFTTKENQNGTGIGLYFSKMIIDGNMKGLLTVENKEDGACFIISVPTI